MSWLDDLLGKTIALGGVVVADRKILNFIQANGITVTIADNPGLGSTDITLTGGSPAQTVIVDQSPAVSLSGTKYNNVGASGAIAINLPATPTVGTVFHARVADAQYIKFVANTGQTIQMDAIVSAVAGYVRSNYSGACMSIEAVSTTRWLCTLIQGPWTQDT